VVYTFEVLAKTKKLRNYWGPTKNSHKKYIFDEVAEPKP